jgi:hypothetical protein
MHNAQPWRFRVHGTTVDLHADPRRALKVTDPDGRALAIGCGAALLGLRLAAVVGLGREPVTRLLPHRADPTHLATVRLAGRSTPTPEDRRLYEALPRRRSDRQPYSGERIPAAVLADLVEAARREGAALHVLDATMARSALALTADADRVWRDDPAYRVELDAWTGGPAERPDGVPMHAWGPRDHDAHLHLRDFGATRGGQGRADAVFEAQPTLAVLSTAADDVADRLRAGQALHRVLLAATAAGVSSSLLGQAVERRELRWLLRDPLHGTGVPQMLIRLGYGGAGASTPRRAVEDVLLDGRA